VADSEYGNFCKLAVVQGDLPTDAKSSPGQRSSAELTALKG
jgi:hypothetical protein